MSEFDTAYVRGKIKAGWRNREWGTVRFYVNWLIWGKWPTLPILGAVVGGLAGVFLADWIMG